MVSQTMLKYELYTECERLESKLRSIQATHDEAMRGLHESFKRDYKALSKERDEERQKFEASEQARAQERKSSRVTQDRLTAEIEHSTRLLREANERVAQTIEKVGSQASEVTAASKELVALNLLIAKLGVSAQDVDFAESCGSFWSVLGNEHHDKRDEFLSFVSSMLMPEAKSASDPAAVSDTPKVEESKGSSDGAPKPQSAQDDNSASTPQPPAQPPQPLMPPPPVNQAPALNPAPAGVRPPERQQPQMNQASSVPSVMPDRPLPPVAPKN